MLTSIQMPAAPLTPLQSRTLAGCTKGGVALAVNGRKGRRVACVLGEDGTALQVFDMEGEEEDDDEEVDAEGEGEAEGAEGEAVEE